MNNPEKWKRFVLVADDAIEDRFQTVASLQQVGQSVLGVSSAGEALSIMSATPPAAIFADAGNIGSTIQAAMKKEVELASIPLVLLSKLPKALLEGQARRGEIAGFIRKPLTADKVFPIVESAVAKEARKGLRIVTAVKCQLFGAQGVSDGLITVLNVGGMFVRTLEDYQLHAPLSIQCNITNKNLLLEGTVVYSCTIDDSPYKEPGVGIKFVNVAPADMDIIKGFIQSEIARMAVPG